MNSLGFIQNVIYGLKQRYGLSLDIYRFSKVEVNASSGQITSQKMKIEIPLAVVMSELDSRKITTIHVVTGERKYSGVYDIGVRVCIIDSIDLPESFIPTTDDKIVVNGVVYQPSKIEEIAGFAFLITMKETKGLKPEQVIDLPVESELSLKQGVNHG